MQYKVVNILIKLHFSWFEICDKSLTTQYYKRFHDNLNIQF